MTFKPLFAALLLMGYSCGDHAAVAKHDQPARMQTAVNNRPDNPYAHIADIPLPEGFARIKPVSNSFAEWLEQVELKKDKTVYKYDGQPKGNQSAQFAVLNISLGNKDLQQCADAVMRLRAEYFFAERRFDEIVFFDNDNKAYRFLPPYTRENFMPYLDRVFGMCGTASLSKKLQTVNELTAIEAGDVIIRGGFPGHAVIVMDVAENKEGKKIYLLAQGYMPAQDIHVLVNPSSESLSPWYEASDGYIIQTPEYTFTKNELKRW